MVGGDQRRLFRWMKTRGLSVAQIPEDCAQLVVVRASGCTATVHLFEKPYRRWRERRQWRTRGMIGLHGVTHGKTEGDYRTPAGVFPIGEAFAKDAPPVTSLPWFVITPATYWVDDPASPQYNRRADSADVPLCGEHMIDAPEYVCGFVIGYNTACVPHRGSAIFFHALNTTVAPPLQYTAGCVAVPEAAVRAYLGVLDAQKRPHILIENV